MRPFLETGYVLAADISTAIYGLRRRNRDVRLWPEAEFAVGVDVDR